MKRAWWGLAATFVVAGISCGAPSLSSVPDMRKSSAVELPRMWLVSVGVSKYKHDGGNGLELKYADEDAKVVDVLFAAPAGPVAKERRKLLVNEEVNRTSVFDALKYVGEGSAENDVIVLFMAMHGIKPEGERFYFMTHKSDPRNVKAEGISDEDVMDLLKKARAKKHVVLIDTCHAGGFGLDSSLRALRAEATWDLLRGFESVSQGTGVLAAAAPGEYSDENARWGGGHGVFTYYLVKGLQGGGADEDKDGVATLEEVFGYVRPRVRKDREAKQNPRLTGHGAIPLMGYPWKPAPRQTASTDGMVQLPRGTFTMGERVDTVTVSSFYMDITEVTVNAYKACVNAKTCTNPDTDEYCNWDRSDRGNHPINCVDWYQAVSYCGWQGKRLPSEEEWEWAARGTVRGTTYPWGNAKPANQLCWDGEGNDKGKGERASTCGVGSYPQGNSPEGIKDLAGNVWEWTASRWSIKSNNFVSRGGGWVSGLASLMRAASRSYNAPSDRSLYVGFRCARTL